MFLNWVRSQIATVPRCQASQFLGFLREITLFSCSTIQPQGLGDLEECEWRRRVEEMSSQGRICEEQRQQGGFLIDPTET